MIPSLCEYRFEHICNVICPNDAAVPPDLNHFGEIDAPFVLLICLVNYVNALDEGSEEGGVDCFAEILLGRLSSLLLSLSISLWGSARRRSL